MNAQKFTQKSLEAIQEAQNLAIENNNMQIEEEHLVAALLQQRDGLIPQLLKKMHVDCDAVQRAVAEKISRIPGVTGPGREAGKIYVSADVDAVLTAAEKETLQSIITANGLSYSDPVYMEDGVTVNMDASRRVVFKFRMKDQEMIEQMSDILEGQQEE